MGLNCFFNYVLIFGVLGFPKLGVAGAAWGTVIAQSVSVLLYVVYTNVKHISFIGPLNEMFALDAGFVSPIMSRTYPTILNETLFSFGSSMFIKAYGLLGTQVTDAYYVGNTITNLFFSVCNGMSVAAGMILGAELGRGNTEEAVKESRWFLVLSLILAVLVSVIIIAFAGPLVSLFGLTDPEVIRVAQGVVRVASIRISTRLIIVVIFSALRAGGDSRFLMVLDSGIMWAVGIPSVYLMISVFGMTDFVVIFLLAEIEQFVRIAAGMKRYHTNRWAVNLTGLVS
jgi:Na+-driven multidrug efflux pump